MAKNYYCLDRLVFAEHPKTKAFKDLTDKRFERLKVLGFAGRRGHNSLWFCQCDCSKIVKVSGSSLKGKTTNSCGCYHSEVVKNLASLHGMSGTPEYITYKRMCSRCNNPKSKQYKDYGGRGIKLLFDNFEQFYLEVGPRPKGTSIERLDNNGHYEVGNVAWRPLAIQANNKRNNNLIELNGKIKTLAQWCGSSETKLYERARHRIVDLEWCPDCALSDLSFCIHRKKRGRKLVLIELNGETKTLAEWCGGSGTAFYSKIRKRIKLDGWCPDCALTKDFCAHRILALS
jgi:hypothetical protein